MCIQYSMDEAHIVYVNRIHKYPQRINEWDSHTYMTKFQFKWWNYQNQNDCQITACMNISLQRLIPVGNWNSHASAVIDVFSDTCTGHGLGTCNTRTKIVLEFAIASSLHLSNTRIKQRDSHLVTYNTGGHSTQLDCIHDRKKFCSAVSNEKVIPDDECTQQHRLVMCDFTTCIPPWRNANSHLASAHAHPWNQLLLTGCSRRSR